MSRPAAAGVVPFAGAVVFDYFIERVRIGNVGQSARSRSNRGAPHGGAGARADAALGRWKALEEAGWDVTALGAVDGSHMIGLGMCYREPGAA